MKFLIILIVLFFFFRLILPHLLRWAIKAFVKKNIQNGTFRSGTFQNGTFQNGTFQNGPFTNTHEPYNQQGAQPEGEIKVDYVPEKDKSEPKDFRGGEYVDYEEVK